MLNLLTLTLPTQAVVELKIVAISGGVYAVLQVLKQAPVLQKYLSGWVAIALNVAMSVTGVLLALQPSQVFTVQTLTTILAAALGAAGIHGTVSALRSKPPGS